MRVCPNCGFHDPPWWRPAKMHNPSGDIDICHIDDLKFNESDLAAKIDSNRGAAITDEHYAYLLTKRARWVRRVALHLFKAGGLSAFNPPYEISPHSPFRKRLGVASKQNTK